MFAMRIFLPGRSFTALNFAAESCSNISSHSFRRKKRRLWATYKKTKEYLAYKRIEKETKRLVRRAKNQFEKKLAREAKKKPKMFYSYLRSKNANKSSVGPL